MEGMGGRYAERDWGEHWYMKYAEMLPTINKLVVFKWKDIASLICDNPNMTNVVEQEYHGNRNECLRQTFINYFINKKPRGYTQDWNGVIELLEDVGLQTLSRNVSYAFSSLDSGDQHQEVSSYSLYIHFTATTHKQEYIIIL